MKFLIFLFFVFCSVVPAQAQEIDYKAIEAKLTGEGLGGWVHGSFKDESLFVFTWRHPDNFFVNVQLPMIAKRSEVRNKLASLGRHDFITIKGFFIKNDAPLQHLMVTQIVEVKKWTGPGSETDYDYKAKIPEELFKQTEMVAKVHAVIAGGRGLVVEYKDVVLPVFNENPKLTEGLFRNDKVRIKYKVQNLPLRPSHLNFDVDAEEPLKVLKRIEEGHGEEVTFTGGLVMFPQSPQIRFNVYALRLGDGEVTWNYTLVNFEDFDLFKAVREKLEKAWNEKAESAVYDRNKFLNSKIKVTVTGLKNVIDAGQANPQIIVNSIDDVKIEFVD